VIKDCKEIVPKSDCQLIGSVSASAIIKRIFSQFSSIISDNYV